MGFTILAHLTINTNINIITDDGLSHREKQKTVIMLRDKMETATSKATSNLT